MAKITFGPIISEARCSTGSVTFTRNRSGAIARNRVTPHNPVSAQQIAQRQFLTYAAKRWSSGLTAAQRAQWSQLAANLVKSDQLGRPYVIAGLEQYSQCAANMLMLGQAPIDNPPAALSAIGPQQVSAIASASAGTLAVTTDIPVPSGYVALVSATKPLSPGKLNVNAWWRLIAPIATSFADGFTGSGLGTWTAGYAPSGHGTWAESADTMTFTPSTNPEDIYNGPNLENLTLWATIGTPSPTTVSWGILARLTTSTGASIGLQYVGTTPALRIVTWTAWPGSVVGTALATYTLQTDTKYHQFALALNGTTAVGYYDGNAVLSATTSLTTSGPLGLFANAATVDVKRLISTIVPAAPNPASLGAAYTSKFGSMIAGQTMGVRVSFINTATGMQSPWVPCLITIGT